MLVARLGTTTALELVLVRVRPWQRREGTGRALVTALVDRFPCSPRTTWPPCHVSDRVAAMRLGKIVEQGDADSSA